MSNIPVLVSLTGLHNSAGSFVPFTSKETEVTEAGFSKAASFRA